MPTVPPKVIRRVKAAFAAEISAHDQQVADLRTRHVFQERCRYTPVFSIAGDLPVRFVMRNVARHIVIRYRREGIGQAALGSVDYHALRQTIPLRFPSKQTHALFPCLSVQELFLRITTASRLPDRVCSV